MSNCSNRICDDLWIFQLADRGVVCLFTRCRPSESCMTSGCQTPKEGWCHYCRLRLGLDLTTWQSWIDLVIFLERRPLRWPLRNLWRKPGRSSVGKPKGKSLLRIPKHMGYDGHEAGCSSNATEVDLWTKPRSRGHDSFGKMMNCHGHDLIVVTWYTWWNRRFKYKDCLNSWISWKSYNYPGLLSNGQEPKWTVQSHRFLYFRIFQVLLCNNTWCTQPLASRSVAGAFWPACLMKWNRRDDSRHDAFRESTIQTRYWIVDLSTYVNCVALFISYSNVYSLHKRSFWSLLKSHIRQPWSRPL